MALNVVADDGSFEDQRSEQCRGAFAFVVIGHRAVAPLLHGKTRLSPIQPLDVTFLIDEKDNRMCRR